MRSMQKKAAEADFAQHADEANYTQKAEYAKRAKYAEHADTCATCTQEAHSKRVQAKEARTQARVNNWATDTNNEEGK